MGWTFYPKEALGHKESHEGHGHEDKDAIDVCLAQDEWGVSEVGCLLSTQILERPFSVVSKPIFVPKGSCLSMFQDLQDWHVFAPPNA